MNRKLIEKADYLLSKERGTVFKDPGGKINMALAYPNIYPVGMSNLGFQGIYRLLNSFGDVVCERVFLPSCENMDEHLRTGTGLFSIESKKLLSRFDILAFSVAFENDYPNILRMLRMSGIPERSGARGNNHPLVIMGGVCAFYNPEPVADFFDICFTGEAEEMLPEFLHVYRSSRSREELLLNSSAIEGVYVPKFYAVNYDGDTGAISEREAVGTAPAMIRKRTVSDISRFASLQGIVTPEMEFSDMYLIEAMRGCPWSCRFCVAGHIYKPVRQKSVDAITKEINAALSATARVGLIGPSLSDYLHAAEVLSIAGVDFSITSLRANPKSAAILRLMKGHKSVSIAPEAGSQRMRNVIGKRITEEDILNTASLILEGDIDTLRLYFMIGLPAELPEDIDAIIRLVQKIRSSSKKGFINLSVSTFVPKPFTPFQWHSMAPLKEIREKLGIIRKATGRMKGVRLFHDVPKYAYMQGLFAQGDRRVSAVVDEVSRSSWAGIGRSKSGIDAAFYIFRNKDFSEILPWDFIDAGVSKDRLWKEYQAALNE